MTLTEIIENGPANAKAGPAFLMHIVLDYLVDQKYKAFDDMEDELEDAEELLLNNVEKFQPMQLIRLRKDLVNSEEKFVSRKGNSCKNLQDWIVLLFLKKQ